MHRGGLATPAGVTVASQWDGHAFRRAGTGRSDDKSYARMTIANVRTN